jgi:4-amino-4-deoxy-L-arabinose transferase-like glycosyltransferase
MTAFHMCRLRPVKPNEARTILCLASILLLGFALRVAYLTIDRFHADEALYAGWALSVASGKDPLLLDVPVDKPPLFLYALAVSFRLFGPSEVTARQLSLASSMLSIALTYRLARRLYSLSTALWSALLLALSPFDILFARTAFTDSMLVLWTLGALCAIVERRWFASGILLGLSFATKQHAVLTIPLVLAVASLKAIHGRKHLRVSPGDFVRPALGLTLGFALPFLVVMAWDAARWATRPGFWHQSALSYGGLAWSGLSQWAERFLEWLGWARYLLGSPILAIGFLVGCLSLLAFGWLRHPKQLCTWLDTLWVTYMTAYLLIHTTLHFSIWDRYLLPLVPLTALLLARIMAQARASSRALCVLQDKHPGVFRLSCLLYPTLMVLVLFLAAFSALRAARNGYPVGGEHWAYQGLDEIAAYLKENAPPDAVLYHHWLRWHYSYYLYGTGFELRWWESGMHMEREVMRTPDRAQYVVLPDWRTLEPDAPGLCFELLYQAHREDETVSLSLYRVYPRLSGCLCAGEL